MKVVLCRDRQDMAERAAGLVELVMSEREAVLGLATGSSPEPLYQELIRRHRERGLDFSRVTAFTLDEYVGLPADHPQSYRSTIRRELTDAMGIPPERLHSPRGDAERLTAEAERYERAIQEAGGIDLQILGIGANGHIGFNEPTSSLGSRTRVKTLSAQTRQDNARFFEDPREVPQLCLTQGLATIGDARCVVLLAQGEHKAEAVRDMIEGPVSASCPASSLQFHRRAVVLLDPGAASALRHRDYYGHVQAVADRLED